jgi:glutamine synthetase
MKVLGEYIWIDSLGAMRSKTKVFENLENNVTLYSFSEWSFDGSSCGMAFGKKSDVVMRPVCFFRDPFRQEWKNVECYLVLCNTYTMDGCPHIANNRHECMLVCEKSKDQDPWFGMEQEYILYELTDQGVKPYGWQSADRPSAKFPNQEHPKVLSSAVCNEILPSAPSYCGVGGDRAFGRKIVEKHFQYCLYAGIKVCGINGEVTPSQWEAQIGICTGEEIGDHLWIARYILSRVAEEYGAFVELHPKPVGDAWNGSGGHCNFSTKAMREEGGLDAIIEACKKMEPVEMRELHLQAYGDESNKLRLSGKHETSKYDEFAWGFSDRGCSVRIPHNAKYAEDRSPSADFDPYKVVTRLLKTICLNEK